MGRSSSHREFSGVDHIDDGAAKSDKPVSDFIGDEGFVFDD